MATQPAPESSPLQITSLVLGVLAVVGMFVAFIPCLGWLNWINIPFACVGLIISAVSIGVAKPGENRGFAIAGVACSGTAILLGIVRLILGAGII